MEKKVMDVCGMTCASCAQRIEKVVRKLPGVGQASVNLATEKLFVEYDPSATGPSAIAEAVERIGYQAIDAPATQVATIPIGGMTCASCSARVEKALIRVDGVEKATVNLATEKATVTYRPQQVRLSALREAIEKAGYQALKADQSDAADADRDRKRRDIRTLWAKFIASAIFSLPLLYIAMAPMLPVRLPFPAGLNPMRYPLIYALVQLFLVAPVMGVGYRFYTVGFKSLWRRSPNMDSLIAV
ncbi:MAG: copper ion binding protein, partial [Clostridiales bacterium]|nr:copper ion binding protein [Clostridiales bacterium]